MPFPLIPGQQYIARNGKVVTALSHSWEGRIRVDFGEGTYGYGPESFTYGKDLSARVFVSEEDPWDLMYPVVSEWEEI